MSFLGGIFGESPQQDKSAPISLVFKSAQSKSTSTSTDATSIANRVGGLLFGGASIRLFDSYFFERNIFSPGSPFRFTAPGLDSDIRMSIRSGDTVQLLVTDRNGKSFPIATGFIDETDTHISPNRVEYVLTGRDTLGQLVDNAAVDANNRIVNSTQLSLEEITKLLILNTRIPQAFKTQNISNGKLIFNTIPGETKINALQRYMEFTNTLIWSLPNGQVVIGKPNFLSETSGTLAVGSFLPILDCRVKRNLNHAIRRIVVQLQVLGQADAGNYTIYNHDSEMQKVVDSQVGRSVYEIFSYGDGSSAVNTITAVGNFVGSPKVIGEAKSQREIARSNVQVLDVEMTVQGHINSQGGIYDVDQLYFVNIPDEDISQNMYVYSVTHELTLEHGMTTKLRLCKAEGTIVAGIDQVPVQ